MQVKLITTMASPEGCHLSGEIVELSSAQAADLIKGGFAVALDAPLAAVLEPVIEQEEPESKPIKKGK